MPRRSKFDFELAVSTFFQMMDRFKVVEGIILICAVLTVPRTHGIAEYTALIVVAIALIALYAWWRRKGIFANRR